MSRIPPLPEPFYGDCDVVRGEAYSADQLRARDRQIVEACIEVARDMDYSPDGAIEKALRSLLGEGEGKE
jgi:hypothetical protein